MQLQSGELPGTGLSGLSFLSRPPYRQIQQCLRRRGAAQVGDDTWAAQQPRRSLPRTDEEVEPLQRLALSFDIRHSSRLCHLQG